MRTHGIDNFVNRNPWNWQFCKPLTKSWIQSVGQSIADSKHTHQKHKFQNTTSILEGTEIRLDCTLPDFIVFWKDLAVSSIRNCSRQFHYHVKFSSSMNAGQLAKKHILPWIRMMCIAHDRNLDDKWLSATTTVIWNEFASVKWVTSILNAHNRHQES